MAIPFHCAKHSGSRSVHSGSVRGRVGNTTTIPNMKTKTSNQKQNGKAPSTESLLAKAAATKKLAKAARDNLKLVKADFKQARKAFKQARKAAKRARKEVKSAVKLLNGKVPKAGEKAKAPVKKAKPHVARAAGATAKTNGGHAITVPMLSNLGTQEAPRTAAQS